MPEVDAAKKSGAANEGSYLRLQPHSQGHHARGIVTSQAHAQESGGRRGGVAGDAGRFLLLMFR